MEKETAPVPPLNQRRERPPPAQEVDELALDTQRVSLLAALDSQLRAHPDVARLLCVCQTDERKQKELEDACTSWIADEPEISGVLAFIGPVALHLLEGPMRKIISALQHFNTFSAEAIAESGENATPMMFNLKILYMSELYTNRAAPHWSSFSYSPAKASFGALGSEATESERVFHAYKSILLACEKVSAQVAVQLTGCSSDEFRDAAPELFRSCAADSLVALEDLNILLAKESVNSFTYAQFKVFFLDPMVLQLDSDKLWPMPPALAY
eukprot:GEMP01050622.1.p1 GENE.GEMP01050622.1~~GEMP01050622.1.p1  ORF type:complete len:270 (+),score=73.46 GEMP01050622.1:174-983(+)